MIEIWKDIEGYEGLYQISNKGNVRSFDRVVRQKNRYGTYTIHIYRGRQLTPDVCGWYKCVDLHKNRIIKRYLIHRLVAEHFIPRVEGKGYINHIDNDPWNNDANNLEWCTQSENIQYAYDQGRKTPPHQKPIGQFTEEMELIRVWQSAAEIGRTLENISAPNVLKVCHGKRKHAGGYKWAYIK